MSHRRPSGFSLADLLVVLAVLVLLVVFLSPFNGGARRKARQSSCLSNQKQFGIGLMMYAQDNDGAFPPAALGGPRGSAAALGVTWADVTAAYLKGPPAGLACPEVNGRNGAAAEYARLYPAQTLGYAYNAFYDAAVSAAGRKPPVLRSPGCMILLAEARPGILALYGPDRADSATPPALVNPRFLEVTAASAEGATRHDEGANYAFADGHAKWYRPTGLRAGAMPDGKAPGFGL